ncbi:glutamine--fructose-6-phosphate transaminase (isomerizing) [Allosediminivita pacifica]|uniref:Glutamine--fructose-6-phosphate aminotransferase [isomerizing] n=1 Tax=Allosediminivita pacifica TaxID=1267769 RepID=A0A2T6ATA1_9RHOB|nr:glutamine--fructose-6-phosphate transaminase (isomerizing) [Allosediminivita pacifica]PTX46956.1 glucosamine--fructose-6-phosphate aminotransferase (isomerizing) [Allosediminivita pacifica]GGB14924.1 glutamine--fructose-6-phosphate aminotransferase [isomerizing] [Allosediminivita pacifica]
MCGIVGILGTHEVSPTLVEALRRLEYRGYDSAGIATLNDGHLDRRRAVGKLVNLSDLLVHEPLPGKAGIGHTRWATHGAPTEANAHPHRAGRVAVVHNGIIENYKDLRRELASAGITPESDTDTETIAQLAQYHLEQGKDPRAAAMATIDRLEGAFALVMLFDGEPDLMIGARKGSPLALGFGEGEAYFGSDAIALAPLTDRITYLEEGDRAVLTRASCQIQDANGNPVEREIKKIQMDAARVDKAGYKHFMAKEIAEQPSVISGTLSAYLTQDSIALPEPGMDFTKVDRLVMVACGTAYYACLTAKYWFEKLAGIPVEVDIASEFRYREPPITPGTQAIFVSQSGETADTLAALHYARGKADRIVAVVNVPESSMAREADYVLPIHAGAEIGVASTKAFTCMLTVLLTMALRASADRGRMNDNQIADFSRKFRGLPGALNVALGRDEIIEDAARQIAEARDVLFLGRGSMYPLALEGALKLKEISYIHAEAYASGELKHGPIALIDKSVPVVVMAPRDGLFEKTVSNMHEVMARGGRVCLITDAAGAELAGSDVWRTILMPEVDEAFAPILYALPAQLLAYHAAVAKGTDVDQPRNLAKSVTVE